jgi:hypothetical protein
MGVRKSSETIWYNFARLLSVCREIHDSSNGLTMSETSYVHFDRNDSREGKQSRNSGNCHQCFELPLESGLKCHSLFLNFNWLFKIHIGVQQFSSARYYVIYEVYRRDIVIIYDIWYRK